MKYKIETHSVVTLQQYFVKIEFACKCVSKTFSVFPFFIKKLMLSMEITYSTDVNERHFYLYLNRNALITLSLIFR